MSFNKKFWVAKDHKIVRYLYINKENNKILLPFKKFSGLRSMLKIKTFFFKTIKLITIITVGKFTTIMSKSRQMVGIELNYFLFLWLAIQYRIGSLLIY